MMIVFWISLFLVLFTYVGFFALLYAVSLMKKKPLDKAEIELSVSLIIAAYNEERVIREKLENTLALDYPKGKLEIVVVTDGSIDRTVEIAREYAARGVTVLHEPERRGKTMALNRVVPLTRGEIIFFSDANTHYAPETVRAMVRNFHDSSVGGVSGKKIIRKDLNRKAMKGEEKFWNYEAMLKILETRVGSISTADGEIFALRRSLFETIPRQIVHDDMYLTLRIVKKGFRVIYEPDATSEESASKSFKDEFFLKTRYASAGYQILGEFSDMLIPPRSAFAWQFLCHKLLRWMAPFFLIVLYVASASAHTTIARIFFVLQNLFYGSALLGYFLSRLNVSVGPLYYPLYFCMGNSAGLYGAFKFLRAGQTSLWRKAER